MRLTPYFAYAKKSFLGRSAYRFDHLMGIFSTCLQVFIYWNIYRALYGQRTEVDGITLAMVTTHFILSMGLKEAFYTDDGYLSRKIRDGSIATELLRPISFKGRMLAENMGNALFNLIFRFIPAVLISVCIVGIRPPADAKSVLLFAVSAVLGYGVLWAISFACQMTAFWLINTWSLFTIKNVFVKVLSGSMLPLWFMPEWMRGVLRATPFSSIYFTPVQIYLGQLSAEEIGWRCLVQFLWAAGIFLLGDLLWRRGQKKLVVQGG